MTQQQMIDLAERLYGSAIVDATKAAREGRGTYLMHRLDEGRLAIVEQIRTGAVHPSQTIAEAFSAKISALVEDMIDAGIAVA